MEYYVFEILPTSTKAKAKEFSFPPHFYIPDQDQSPPSSSPVHCLQGSLSTKTKDPKLESKCTDCGKGFETNQANLKSTPKRPVADHLLLPNSLTWAATRKFVWKPAIDKNSLDAVAAALTLVKMSRSKSNWSYQNVPLDEKKHVSENCNKSFPSDQALVEHGSSHKIKEIRKNEAIQEPTEVQKSRKRKRKMKSESGSHVCEICNKSYAMGQQLGGHKRVHYPKPKNPTPISEVPDGQVSEVPNGQAALDSLTLESF